MELKLLFFISFLLWSSNKVVQADLKFFGQDFTWFGESDSTEYVEDKAETESEIQKTTIHGDNPIHHVNFTHEGCQNEVVRGYTLKGTYHPLNSSKSNQNIIRFLVRLRGKSDGHIILSTFDRESRNNPFYTIVIGSQQNGRTDIRRCINSDQENLARVSTPDILSEHIYRGFIIEYQSLSGKIAIYPENSQTPLILVRDSHPVTVNFFSFTAYDHITVHVAFNCVGNDAFSLVEQEQLTLNRTGSTHLEAIRQKLLDHYDNKVTPVQENGDATKVGVGMTVNYFTLEEAEHVFIVNAWMRLSWKDPRLQYNSSVSGGTMLRFGSDELWKPDILLYNNAYPTEIDHYGDTHMVLSPDGTVLWVPPARLAAHCTLNMIRWPYDTHTCELKFGCWTHHGHEIDLYYSNQGNNSSESEQGVEIEYTNYVTNSEWTLLKSSHSRNALYYACCPEPYIDITFSFTFQRNSPSYVATFVVPIIFIVLLNMLVFLLPPTSGEKLTLGSVQFFILCIFLLYFQAKVPPLGDHLPLLVLLYVINLVLVSISLVISVIVLNMSRTRKVSSPPHCLRILCNVHFATVLGLGHLVPFVSKTHSRLNDGVELTSTNQARQSSDRWHSDLNGAAKDEITTHLVDYDGPYMLNADWILLATMIDRIAFIIYAVVNGIILALCLA